jgi:hypothetical protein
MKYSPFANTIHKIINDLYENKDIKYLELGLNCGTNFNSLLIKNKKSVDIKFSQVKPTYLMTTDKFFEQNSENFDLIYVDADHEYSQVIKDYNNSVDCISKNGIIFLHDLYPPDENHTNPELCYNSYKILNYFVENNYDIIVNIEDYGACSVFNPQKIDISKFDHNITYNQLINKISNSDFLMKSYDDFFEKYKKKING